MLDNLQKYWKIWSTIAISVVAVITWIVNLEPRIPDTVEEMIDIRNAIKAMPTPGQKKMDSLNDIHAIEIRQLRYEDAKRKDSMETAYNRRKDSITLDYIKRFTVQIEQIKQEIELKKINK